MARCDTDCCPMLLIKCRVGLCKLISVFFVVSNIWFGVDENSGATSKKNPYMYTTR